MLDRAAEILSEGRDDAQSTPSPNCESRWYLIHCKPREDEREMERRRAGRKCTVAEPLFPRYLFILLDSVNDNWYPIRSTRGVNQIVRFNEHPLPVRNEIIDGIRRRLAGGGLKEPYLKPGERVQITEGAFSQLEAIFLANDGDQRVVLLLNIMQTDQKVSFPVDFVRKIG